MNGDGGEHAIIRILVADHRPFQRRLIAEALRAHGRMDVGYAETADQCLATLAFFQPDALVADWNIDGGGLDLVRRLRAGEAGEPQRRLPVIMLGADTRASDIEYARNSGVDEFVTRPFSTAVLVARVHEARARPREFVQSTHYTGPCRRRRRDEEYDGPRRRMFDCADKDADAPDVQVRKGLARMYVERIGILLRGAASDADGMREVCLACAQLSTLAADMKDRLLVSASSSLFNYLKGVAAGDLNLEVAQAHLDAIVQLAELPNSRADVRQTVTQQLNLMVAKKLRQAGQAA